MCLLLACVKNANANELKYSLYSMIESSSNVLFGHSNPVVEDVVEKYGVKFDSKRKWPTGNLNFKANVADHRYRDNSLNNEARREGVISLSQDIVNKRLSVYVIDELKQVKEDEFSLYSSINDQEVEKINYGLTGKFSINRTNKINMKIGVVETDFKKDPLSNSLSDKNSLTYQRFFRSNFFAGVGYAESYTRYLNDGNAASDVDIVNNYIYIAHKDRYSRYDVNLGVSEINLGASSYDSDSFKISYKNKNGNRSLVNVNLSRQIKDNGSLVIEDEDLLLARRGVSKESRLDLLLMKKVENSQYDIKLYGLLIEELGVDSDKEIIKAILSYKYKKGRYTYTLTYQSFEQIAFTNVIETTNLDDDTVSAELEYLLSKKVKSKVYIKERKSNDLLNNSEINDTLFGVELSYNVVN